MSKSLFDCVTSLIKNSKNSFFKKGDLVEMIDNGNISVLSAKSHFIKGKIYEIIDVGFPGLDAIKIAESKEGIHESCNVRRIRKIS